jgi:hypothetical protein
MRRQALPKLLCFHSSYSVIREHLPNHTVLPFIIFSFFLLSVLRSSRYTTHLSPCSIFLSIRQIKMYYIFYSHQKLYTVFSFFLFSDGSLQIYVQIEIIRIKRISGAFYQYPSSKKSIPFYNDFFHKIANLKNIFSLKYQFCG